MTMEMAVAPATTDAGTDPWADEDVTSAKGAADENFPVGSALIAKRLRPHVHAYYAFARTIDDIVDNARLSPRTKVARLDAMEAILLGHAAPPPGRADAATAARLRASLAATGVGAVHGTDLIVAFRQDAVKNRYADWPELAEYCRYSANPVGRYLLDLHGESAATHAPSDALCTSLQVLNHLQDLKGDLREMDRSYLPADLLARQGAQVGDVLAPRATPALRRVIDALLDECDRLNAEARALPRLVRDRRMRLEAAVIVNLADRLAARLRREDPVAGRVKLGKGDAARSLLGALRHWSHAA